ncbi:TIGR03663 family protein [bacterium]|nr:TIGR03663 family protein [candidate division CSSED10-310 bacterium]
MDRDERQAAIHNNDRAGEAEITMTGYSLEEIDSASEPLAPGPILDHDDAGDRRVTSRFFRANWYYLLWVAVLLFTAYTRLHHLGDKPFHHDESLYAKYIWNFFTGYGYQYDPMQHGPFMFHISQVFLFLFGVSNYTIRLLMAVMGIGMVIMAWFFRHRLGDRIALLLGFGLAISPHVMYFNRFLRHDTPFAFFCMALVLFISYWLHTRRPLFAYLSAAALSILFCIKENAFVMVVTLISFALLVLVYRLVETYLAGGSMKDTAICTMARFPLISKGVVLMLVWAASLTVYAVLHLVLRTGYQGNWALLVRIYWVICFAVMLGLIGGTLYLGRRSELALLQGRRFYHGLFEDSRLFAWCAGIFAGIFIVLYTTFGFNPGGFWQGVYGWFEYWLNQHQIKRIAGPFFYYNWKLINYEILMVVPALVYALLKLSVRTVFIIGVVIFLAVMILIGDAGIPGINHEYFMGRDLVFAIGFMAAGIWSVCQHLKERRPFAAFLIHWSVTSYLAYSYLQEKVPWLGLHITIPATFLGAVVIDAMLEYRRNRTWRIAGFILLGLFAAYEIHSGFLLNWYNESDPREQVVYVQSTTDMPRLVKEIEQVAEMRGEGKNMPLVYGGEATWPLYWYLRDWNKVVYLNSVSEIQDVPVVVCDWKQRFEYARTLGEDYRLRRYKIRHWWIFSRNDFDPNYLKAAKQMFRWLLFREMFKPEIYGSEDCAVFFHKDAAQWSWSKDPGPPPPDSIAPERGPEPVTSPEKHPVVLNFGGFGTGNGAFSNPGAIALDATGNIYVADTDNNRIQKFSPQGEYLRSIGSAGDQPGQFNKPRGVAVDSMGFIYVADTWNHRIQRFNPEGEYVSGWGSGETYWAPKHLVVTPDNHLFIVDTGFHRIHKTDLTGRELKLFGKYGSLSDEFQEPVGIAFDSAGNLLIADSANRRIKVYSTEGVLVRTFPVYGWEFYYTEPYLAVTGDGRILATDSQHHRIQILSPEGELLAFWGEEGTAPGQFLSPIGIAAAGDRIFVGDSQTHRIQVFEIPAAE